MEDSFITKDVFYDCIPIHGNTVFSSFSISPDLPQDLSIDPDRSCIGGVYTGNFYGSQKYLIEGITWDRRVPGSLSISPVII